MTFSNTSPDTMRKIPHASRSGWVSSLKEPQIVDVLPCHHHIILDNRRAGRGSVEPPPAQAMTAKHPRAGRPMLARSLLRHVADPAMRPDLLVLPPDEILVMSSVRFFGDQYVQMPSSMRRATATLAFMVPLRVEIRS